MKYLAKYLMFFILLHLVVLKTYCQKFQSDYSIKNSFIELRFSGGSLIPHHKELQVLKDGYISAFEFSLGKYSNGSKSWHRAYNFPAFGITYQFMNLGSSAYLGTSHALLPFIFFVPFQKKGKLYIKFRTAGGINYVTKKYDEENNPKNVSISTNLNSVFNLATEAEFLVNQNLALQIGAGLNHISNGNFQKPNYGLNFFTISSGVSYRFGEQKFNLQTSTFIKDKSKCLRVLGVFSIKEEKDPGGPKFSIFSGSLEYSYIFSEFVRLNTLIDVMQDNSTGYVLDYENIVYNSNLELLKIGASIQPEFALDRLSFILGIGVYAFNKNPNNGILYQRIGVRYRFTPSLWTHIALKTHWNVADYVELGLLVCIWDNKP